MISYAQNFEDVMLWRALKHIESGFYVDVGAWSPDKDSVTKLFYENDWQGINVEPNPEFYNQYLLRRNLDINLNIALSDEDGETTIYFVDTPGLSSLDKQVAESHSEIGFSSKPSKVKVSTLATILARHANNQDIHFLKIDVEGFEKQVLLGNDWAQFRPWVLVIEATKPMSQEENYQDWESIVLDAEYNFAYADGLNRFYVANEHQELLCIFKYPPNVFDDFVLHNQVVAEVKASEAEVKASEAEVKASEAEVKASEAEVKASEAEVKASEAEHLLYLVLNSTSWKLTAPLRNLNQLLPRFKNGVLAWLFFKPHSRPRRVIKSILMKLKFFVSCSPKLKKLILILLKPFPSLSTRLSRVGQSNSAQNTENNMPKMHQKLSPRAKQIYAQLKQAVEDNKKESS